MAYKRRNSKVDIRQASLRTLTKHLDHARSEYRTFTLKLTELQTRAGPSPHSRLEIIQKHFAKIDERIKRLENVRQPRTGLLPSLLRLTEIPADVHKELISLRSQRSALEREKKELEYLIKVIEIGGRVVNDAQAQVSRVEDAIGRKRRKEDKLTELRAAAARNATETRRVGAFVKRKLKKQPWCPYCGGSLGHDPHADHIYPLSKGGRSVARNMVYVCSDCNRLKRDLTLTGFIRKYKRDHTSIEDRLTQLGKEF